MPKLDSKVAQATASAESGWDMEEGVYVIELKSVNDTDPKTKKPYEGPKGPYWTWVVKFPKDANEGRYKGRELYRPISLGEDAANMLKEAYAAFGDPTCSVDTDELIGNRALVEVINEEYNGELRAKVKKFMPLDDAEQTNASGGKSNGGTESPDNF